LLGAQLVRALDWGFVLTRIEKIDGVGLFHGARGGAIKLEPLSLIYAGNGRGKSTLSAILRSVSLRRASDILERVTIDGSSSPAVTLQFESGQRANFQAGAWDCARPEIVVFDATFIEANVFSGVAVTSRLAIELSPLVWLKRLQQSHSKARLRLSKRRRPRLNR
jgi:wobble nucleotide-excising tRNase